eukprot:7383710-Prymnesium_polylepis.1
MAVCVRARASVCSAEVAQVKQGCEACKRVQIRVFGGAEVSLTCTGLAVWFGCLLAAAARQ